MSADPNQPPAPKIPTSSVVLQSLTPTSISGPVPPPVARAVTGSVPVPVLVPVGSDAFVRP